MFEAHDATQHWIQAFAKRSHYSVTYQKNRASMDALGLLSITLMNGGYTQTGSSSMSTPPFNPFSPRYALRLCGIAAYLP